MIDEPNKLAEKSEADDAVSNRSDDTALEDTATGDGALDGRGTSRPAVAGHAGDAPGAEEQESVGAGGAQKAGDAESAEGAPAEGKHDRLGEEATPQGATIEELSREEPTPEASAPEESEGETTAA